MELFQPLTRILPGVKSPQREVGFTEKLIWTAVTLVVYLIMAETPIYGITHTGNINDQFGPLRVIFASNRGTLVELGIGPIVTAGLILQVLSGSKMINVDFTNPADRALFTGASKVLSVFMTIFEGIAFLIGGAYNVQNSAGQLITPSLQAQFLILVQLVVAGVVIILLDEMLQKNWGFGSGISLFIAAGVCLSIVWSTIGPISPVADGKYFGAIFAFAQSIGPVLSNPGSFSAWQSALYRGGSGLPDMVGLFTTLGVFILIIYLNGLRVEVPVSYARYRGFRGRFPIKFFYVSNIPVIFAAALFGNIFFIGQLLFQRYNPTCSSTGLNFWLSLFPGCFVPTSSTNAQLVPSKGLAYYTFAPRSITVVLQDPIRAAVYMGIFVLACVFFAVTWVEVGGMDSKTVAKQLIDSGMQVEGFRRSGTTIRQILDRYIPTVTIIGGIVIGTIAAGADFLGAFGTGTGILLTVGIIEQYYEILVKERITEIYPGVKGFLGQ
ncbi:preprotein translocase subunit SecY [Candidatus Bathyarchaeota archaeon]|nr:MAG: preprotein translocase subunit SecY [Candidatus Bathyarchaeota archaeon]